MKRQVHVKPEIRKAFEAKFVETLEKAKRQHGKDIPPIPFYFIACGSRAGYFKQEHNTDKQYIVINPDYFTKPGGYEEQLNVIMPHEAAHYITRTLYGIDQKTVKSHGWQWAEVMKWIGLRPIRCHRMDSEGIVNRHERPYKYQCSSNCSKVEHLFTARTHIKAQNWAKLGGMRYYLCKRCRSKLVYVGLVHNGQFTPAVSSSPRSVNRIETISLGPKTIGIKFVPITTKTPVVATVPEPKTTHRTVTRWVNGMLQNIRIPIEERA